MAFKNQTIWIIGASSGIGESLAKCLHEDGANLILSARSHDKLSSLNALLGGKHLVIPFDISDFTATKTAIQTVNDHSGKIDRIICLAGQYEPSAITDMTDEDILKIIAVNLSGVMHFARCAYLLVRDQSKAQLAFCASVAGYTGLPNAQPYAASKAGLINFVQSLRLEAQNHIDIKLINPGFVRTPLTDKNKFDMPFIIETDKAAEEIAKGLNAKGFEIHFPKKLSVTLKLISILPNPIKIKICKKFKT